MTFAALVGVSQFRVTSSTGNRFLVSLGNRLLVSFTSVKLHMLTSSLLGFVAFVAPFTLKFPSFVY